MPRKSLKRTAILDRVIGHLYFRAQKAQGREEHELWTITLRLVGIARRGDLPTLDQAAYMTVGRSFEKWRQGTTERLAMMAQELAACVPDYDPQEAKRANLEQAARVRRPEPFSGNVYAFEKTRPARSPEPESLPAVPAPRSRDGTG